MSRLTRSCVAVAALAAAVLGTVQNAHADVGPTIIGGGPVASAPWAAGMYTGDHFGCTASIIAERWVMTARHCVVDEPTHVLIGDVRINEGTRANVDGIERAPGADIALLHLDRSVETTYVQLADVDPPVGSTNYIYGWGTIEVGENSPISDVLKRASVRVTGPERDAYGGRAVGTTKINGTAGYGDSGGPQFYGNTVVGVCSTGDYVTTQYASVAANRSWIRSVAGV